MTDKERILTNIIMRLKHDIAHIGGMNDESTHGDHVHFACYGAEKPKVGELVIAETVPWAHDYTIGFLTEIHSGMCVIREIGTDRLCNYSNESFRAIRGLQTTETLEGKQYEFYKKVLTAFRKGDEYSYRFGGISFDGPVCKVVVREAFGGLGHGSVPFTIEMPWTGRRSVKGVLQAMRDGGYGTRSFRPEPEPQP